MSNEIQTLAPGLKTEPRRRAIGFDYTAPAELFPSRMKKGRPQTRYRRFDTAAEAIRFAVEEIAPPALLGAYLEVNETRLGMNEIRELYEDAAFPLQRLTDKKR
jgi:hypothetical protein